MTTEEREMTLITALETAIDIALDNFDWRGKPFVEKRRDYDALKLLKGYAQQAMGQKAGQS
jgi:hypothetical protein